MIDPISIGLVISGAKALKGAFDTAKEAMDEFRDCAEAGHSALESMGSMVKFFTAQGEVRKHLAEANEPKVSEDGTPAAETRSDTAIALEAMQYERQLRADEDEIKNYLIYQCNEGGLYQELCERRDAMASDRAAKLEEERRKRTEAILALKRLEMARRRKRQQRINLVTNTISVIIGSAACAGLIYGIWWMFQQGS